MQTQWSVIIEILERLADLQFQREVWVEHKIKHPLLSFAETINTLGDYFFFESIKNKELALSMPQYEILNRYIEELLCYQEPSNSNLILTDPNWLRITDSTKEVINILEASSPPDVNNLRNIYSYEKGLGAEGP